MRPSLSLLLRSLDVVLTRPFRSLHMLNAGKYTVTISYFMAYYSWRIHEHNGDNVPWRLALFIIFATFNTLYTSTWGASTAPPPLLSASSSLSLLLSPALSASV